MARYLTWCDIDSAALAHNFMTFQGLAGPDCRICAVVKSNAYGHGMEEAARAFIAAGAGMLGVHSLDEALRLRAGGTDDSHSHHGLCPHLANQRVAGAGFHIVLYVPETLEALLALEGPPVPVHLKIETGTQRQGIRLEDLGDFTRQVLTTTQVRLAGATTHFANIEDTTDHSFAARQLERFAEGLAAIRAAGGSRS